MKKLLLLLALIGMSKIGQAQNSAINGDCTIGGQQVLTQGMVSSATKQIGTSNRLPGAGVQASFPYCLVTVYNTGTLVKPTIYSNVSGTVLANPFSANNDGSWTFFAAQGFGYDIVLSSGTAPGAVALPYSRTYSDVFLGGSGGGGGGGVTGPTTNGGLVGTTTLGIRTDCGNGGQIQYNGTAWVCGGALPLINIKTFGAKGDGTTDDTAAINTAYLTCPQTSPVIGCNVFWPAGIYKVTSTINQALLKSVHSFGEGTCGTTGCATLIQTNGAIWGFTIGTGSSPNTSGFIFENIGFKDATGNGLGGLDVLATRDGLISNVACVNYTVGVCFQPDGGTNFTQFITAINLNSWQTKYRISTKSKTASIYVYGGEGNCQTSTDVISGSIDIDLGFVNHTASTGTASEWVITSQTQNCQTGRALWNAGGNKFVGDKAVENTINARPNLSFGVLIDGDSPSIANGNSFINEQVTKAGTAFYLKPFATNTIIDNPIFNGTNGVDIVEDSGAYTTTKLNVIKQPTGWTTNVSAISRASNIVTATTTFNSENGDLSIVPGTLLYVFNSTGGSTSFNGTFPVVTVSTNDSTNITTLTWNQTGANESATINTGACGGAGTCVTPLSSVLNAGVGQIQLNGDQITQGQTFQTPPFLPVTSLSTTAMTFFDGSYFDIIEANGGVLHLSDGPGIRFTGSTGQSYTPQPTTTAGYGVAGVPNCSALITPNPQTAVPCATSDDKGNMVATNTNGTTVCLPPPGTANGYPPHYSWSIAFAPGSGPNYLSVTPPGHTSLYSIACAGTSATLDGLTTARNLSIQQGVKIWTDGNNWFTMPGEPSIPLDQLKPALSNVAINLDAGDWTGGGSGGNAGGSINIGAGNTNDTAGAGGTIAIGGNGQGHAAGSGLNGATQIISTFQAGASTTGKEGSIARLCNDFTSDCSAGVHVTKGAVRITISDTGDPCCAIGIISSGASIGNPTEVVTSGLYPAPGSAQVAAVSENACTANEFFLVSQVSSSTNGRGYCSVTDGPLRIGYTAASTAVSAPAVTCNTTTPCNVILWVAPAGLGTGSTTFTAAGDLSGSNSTQEVTGILSKALPSLPVSAQCLEYTGSAWLFAACGGSSSITITNGTGITGGGTGASFTLAVTAPVVRTDQSNTYTAGMKQIFGASGTTAGLRFSGVTADPSGLAGGDMWFRSDLPFLNWYDGTTTQSLMNQTTKVTLAQLNDGAPGTGRIPYENTGGANLAWLSPGGTGCMMDLTGGSLPQWDSNVCFTASNLTVNGTVTATSFVGTGPYYLKTPPAGGALSTPGAGNSAFAVGSDNNFYFSINNGTFGQVPYIAGGAVAADQFALGSAAGTFVAETIPACADTTGNHLNFTHAGGITCGTSTGIGFALTTGHLVAGVAGVATDAGTDFTLNTSTHTMATGASGILNLSASPVTTGLKIPTTAGAAPLVDGQIASNSTTHTFAYGCNGATCTAAQTVAASTATMATGAIGSGTCATVVSVTGTGILTTDVVHWGFNGDPTGITGYAPAAGGVLTVVAYPTADHANFKICNNTGGSITPGGITFNWIVTR